MNTVRFNVEHLPLASRPQSRATLGPNAHPLAHDAAQWLKEHRPDVPPSQHALLADLLGSIGNAAGWRPPVQTITTDEEMHALPTGASGISEQGGCFTKGDDGHFYEAGRTTAVRAEDIALPFDVHAVYAADQ